MRVVNRIVNILVLVFAIAAVVFSYLLFNKREKLVSGWEQMAQTINQTARNLDAKSGTKLAAELDTEKLNHKQFNKTDLSELEKALPKLPEGAKKIIAQRDALAEALNKVGQYAEINDVKTADLEKLDTSAAKQQQIISGAKRTADRNAQIFNDYVRISGSAGAGTSVGELKRNPTEVARKFTNAVNAMKNRINVYNQNFAQIARTVGAPAPQLGGNKYADALKKLQQGVNKMRDDLNKTRRELAQVKRERDQKINEGKSKDKRISDLNATIRKKDAEIRKLSLLLNPDGGLPPSDMELYSKIQGKVEQVNDRWGFVVLNLGAKIPVVKKFKKESKVLYMDLLPGYTITVARNLASDKPQFIAKVVVTQVGDNYAVANIDKASIPSEEVSVQPGDAVYFTTEDTAANLKIKEARAKAAEKK